MYIYLVKILRCACAHYYTFITLGNEETELNDNPIILYKIGRMVSGHLI